MTRILVTYATMAGSTAEVARAVAEAIETRGATVDVFPIRDAPDPADYDGVVVGGPMIMGWHREARGFLKRHRAAWRRVPLAVFVLAISLTDTGETAVDGVPVTVDEGLPKRPARPGRLSFRERYARLPQYVRPILKAARPARPVDVAVFGGRLEYGRLKWWAVLFAMLVIRATAGDKRDWAAIRAWGERVGEAMARVPAA